MSCKSEKINVCNEIVANDLCSGCGTCAGICPANCLEIQFNSLGEYVALERDGNGCNGCGLCLKVCPKSDISPSIDKIAEQLDEIGFGKKYEPELGHFSECLAGYSKIKSHRKKGSSGGMVTWTLEKLLEKGIVDKVICVAPEKVQMTSAVNGYKVCHTIEDVRACSKSCYYPVELSRMIDYMKSNDGHYAVVALPCAIKGLRLAMKYNSVLRDRIKHILGLTCGHGASAFASEFLCANRGGNPHDLRKVTFRHKVNDKRWAHDFGVKCTSHLETGSEHESMQLRSEGFGAAQEFRWFIMKSCDFCDDAFAELADVSFMDAWIPDFYNDPKGNSIVLVRNQGLSKLYESGIADSEVCLSLLPPSKVVSSQSHLIYYKRKLIEGRVALAKKLGEKAAPIRHDLCKTNLNVLERRLVRILWDMRQSSPLFWQESGKRIDDFMRRMGKKPSQAKWIRRIMKSKEDPLELLRFIVRKVKSRG